MLSRLSISWLHSTSKIQKKTLHIIHIFEIRVGGTPRIFESRKSLLYLYQSYVKITLKPLEIISSLFNESQIFTKAKSQKPWMASYVECHFYFVTFYPYRSYKSRIFHQPIHPHNLSLLKRLRHAHPFTLLLYTC